MLPTTGQWMDYNRWLGSLGNLFTASGSSDPGAGRARPSGLILRRVRCTSFHIHSSRLTFFLCVFILFILAVHCASVWENTRA